MNITKALLFTILIQLRMRLHCMAMYLPSRVGVEVGKTVESAVEYIW